MKLSERDMGSRKPAGDTQVSGAKEKRSRGSRAIVLSREAEVPGRKATRAQPFSGKMGGQSPWGAHVSREACLIENASEKGEGEGNGKSFVRKNDLIGKQQGDGAGRAARRQRRGPD